MSQTTLHDSIKSWTPAELAERWQEATVQLISKLESDDESSCETLKTIYSLLIPSMPTDNLEASIFSKVCERTDVIYNSLLESIVTEAERVRTLKCAPDSVKDLLQCCLDIVSGLDSCVNYLTNVTGGFKLRICQLRSLPGCVIAIINKSYIHCKESESIYGDWFNAVSERLSAFFKCVHHLQTTFSSLLDKLDMSCLSVQETKDLSCVVVSLSAVCDVASHLDVKVMVTLWKTISRLSCLHKKSINEYIDIDAILYRLCGNTSSALSQSVNNNVEAQNKSIKVIGFYMKVLVALVSDYIDSIAKCVRHIFSLILQINGMMYNTSSPQPLLESNQAEFKRQVYVGLEPLITSLVSNREFIRIVTSGETAGDGDGCDTARLLTYISITRALSKVTDETIRKSYIDPVVCGNQETRSNILETVFDCFSKCYVDLCVPLLLPGVMCDGKPSREISLFEYACTHICAFVATYPADHFHTVENCLLNNVLGQDLHAALLAIDVWCFVARCGSANLCRDHCRFLVSLYCQRNLLILPEGCHVVLLLRRLIGCMSSHHQEELLNAMSMEECCKLFAVVPLSVIQSLTFRQNLFSRLITHCCLLIENWVVSFQPNLFALCDSLSCTARITDGQDFLFLSEETRHRLLIIVDSLLVTVDSDKLPRHMVGVVLPQLIQVISRLLPRASDSFKIKVLSYCNDLVRQSEVLDVVKLNVCDLLSPLATIVFPPSNEQTHLLRVIAELFNTLLSDSKSLLVKQRAIEVFASFAEKTAHESIVSDSLMGDENMRRIVVDYLNQLVSCTGELAPANVHFLRAQYKILCDTRRESPDVQLPDVDFGEHKPLEKRRRLQEEGEHTQDTTQLSAAIEQIEAVLETVSSIRESFGTLPEFATQRLLQINVHIEALCR